MPTFSKKGYNYNKIDQNQFEVIKLGTKINYKDVLIAKTKLGEDNIKVDSSTIYDST